MIQTKSNPSNAIKQVNSDPGAPSAGETWVLKTVVGGSGAGEAFGFLAYTNPGVGGSTSYELKYHTSEGTTVSVALT